METFTLIVWLMMGHRFEENRIPNLGREECVERLDAIERGRHTWNFQQAHAKGQCVGASGYTWPSQPEIMLPPVCATGSKDWCGGPLPGRKRV